MRWLTHDMRINPAGTECVPPHAKKARGLRAKQLFDAGYDTSEIARKLELSETEVMRRLHLARTRAEGKEMADG